MEGSDQLESCVKCHCVKYRSVEPWDINLRGVTNGIRAGRTYSAQCHESIMLLCAILITVFASCVIVWIPTGSYFLVDTGSNG